MKKRNVIIIAVCVLTAIILVFSFSSDKKSGGNDNFKVKNSNSIIGIWQEIPDDEDTTIRVWEFCDNGVVLISNLSKNGNMYKHAEEFLDQSGNLFISSFEIFNPFRYTISENILTLYKSSDATVYMTFRRIKDDSFLLAEQQKIKGVYEKY